MHTYSKNYHAEFHHNLIWNDGAPDFFVECHPNKNRWVPLSVSDAKISSIAFFTINYKLWIENLQSLWMELLTVNVQSVCVGWFAGIAFRDNLDEILKYISNPATQDYIVQKYIGLISSIVVALHGNGWTSVNNSSALLSDPETCTFMSICQVLLRRGTCRHWNVACCCCCNLIS